VKELLQLINVSKFRDRLVLEFFSVFVKILYFFITYYIFIANSKL